MGKKRSTARAAVPTTTRLTTPDGTWIAAAGIGGVSLMLYLLTLHPGVPGGDSGELIGAAATTGVAHPSGYPLMLLLAKLAGLVPVADFATRINALSALADAAAAALLCYAGARASGSIAGGLIAAGLWAFSSRVWQYATVAEVFALNNLIVAALIATFIANAQQPSRRVVAMAALLTGLGVANHLTSIFFSVPILLFLLFEARRAGASSGALVATAAGWGTIGLLPYLYLPFASAGFSAVAWGDQTTVAGFVTHVLRAEYGILKLGNDELGSVAGFVEHLWVYLRDVPREVLWIGVPLFLAGVVVGLRRLNPARRPLALLLAALAFYVIVFNALSNLSLDTALLVEIQSRFWQMPNQVVGLFVAVGFGAFVRTLPQLPRAVPIAAALLAVAVQAAANFGTMDESENRWVDIYGRSILAAAPPRALILSRGDLATNSLRYLRYGEQVRPDVDIVDQEELSRSWGPARYARRLPAVKIPGSIYDPGRQDGFSIAQFINANIDRAPIVVCGGFKPGDGSVTKAAYRVVPVGLCSEVLRANAPFAFNEWLDRSRALLPDVAAFAATPPRPAMFEYLALADYWNAWHARAYFVRSCEDCGLSPDERLRRFADMAEEIIRLGPSPPIEVYKNLAAVLLRLYATRPEVKDRLVAALQAYMKAAPADDRDLPAIRDALAKLK